MTRDKDHPGHVTSGHRWDPDGYSQHAHFVPALGDAALGLLAPQPGERILDLGCGDGALTQQIVESGAHVVAVDASPEMVARARERGLDAHVADGHALDFAGAFDAVFSNAALHWMHDHDRVLGGVARALKPGGRFVGEFGGHGNVAAICAALMAALDIHGGNGRARLPWVFPTAERFAVRLEAHGLAAVQCELVARPTPLPTGLEGWLDTFAKPFLAHLSPPDQAAVRTRAVALLRPVLCDEDGRWTADYVRLRFAARRPT